MECKHENFEVAAIISRLVEKESSQKVTGYQADIKIHCSQCGQAFEFIGLPQGYSPSGPHVSVDGTELRQPIRPANQPIDKNPNITYH